MANFELDDHEATGKLQRVAKLETKPEPEVTHDPNKAKVFGVNDAHDFELAISRAKFKMRGGEAAQHLFVTKEFMTYLTRGSTDQSITYQDVRCYVDGSKQELDKQEAMSSEKRADYLAHIGRTPEEIAQLKKEAMESR